MAEGSGEDGIVLEKRERSPEAFLGKAATKAYALPLDFYRYRRI
ncbi:MAG TPA: hypothetical protein VGI33_06935 [Paenibacillus sp.]